MDDEYFIILYITDTIPKSPVGHQLPTQAKWNVWIIAINWEEPITTQCAFDVPNFHWTPHGKSKVNISIFRRQTHQRTDLEEIHSIFDQFRHVVSHIEVRIHKKPPTPKNIGEGLKGPQKTFCKEYLFVQYDKNKNVSLLSDPITIIFLPRGTKVLHSLIATSIKEDDCYDA